MVLQVNTYEANIDRTDNIELEPSESENTSSVTKETKKCDIGYNSSNKTIVTFNYKSLCLDKGIALTPNHMKSIKKFR